MSKQLGSNFSGTVFIAADHAGFEMKEFIEDRLAEHGFKIFDLGAHEYDQHDDYTTIVRPVRDKLLSDHHARAIVFCGSGQGEGMVLNRTHGVRAAVFYGPRSAIVPIEIENTSPSVDGYDAIRLARLHNDANALCIGARFMTTDEAYRAAMLFLGTPFSGTDRHARRVKAIDAT
jgi:ribose 5-phosphate isomerase B